MNLSDNHHFSMSMALLIFLNFAISIYYFYYTAQTGLDTMLFFMTIALIFIGVSKGLLLSLGISLLVIFFFGSYMILAQTMSTDTFFNIQGIASFSVSKMIIWQMILLVTSFVSGHFHKKRKIITTKYHYWKEQYYQLVTIDPATNFDNEKRFYMQLNESFKRASRYEQSFSLLLIQLKNWETFKKLYGEKETNHVLQSFANQVTQATRASDSRFRIFDDTFALLLPETDVAGVETVMKKIIGNMKDYTLSKKNRMVTIEFAFGYCVYHEQLDDYMRMFNNAFDELNNYVA
ncbi:GGDEF domain-containing protein [Paraliobacillus sp. JSM ZJ581]|uniref:GGDEF domain-containing protein n=1 Tax=Paraliobacillus sp. JSM ZJ581 TaxID=3342118 RepID=UPI0035A8B705